MSKMGCPCGGIISDVVCPSPTEGWLFREQDEETFSAIICRDIAAFFAAVHSGQRETWIRQFFPDPYPTDVDDEGMVSDIIAFHARTVRLSICECAKCGRLHVQRSNGVNSYIRYSPDESGYKGVLRSQTATGLLHTD